MGERSKRLDWVEPFERDLQRIRLLYVNVESEARKYLTELDNISTRRGSNGKQQMGKGRVDIKTKAFRMSRENWESERTLQASQKEVGLS